MKNKGVSPIIATILLIAMTIALALIIFTWMMAFSKETVTKTGGENIEQVCTKVVFEASRIGDQISVSNIGSIPIYSMRIKLESVSGTRSPNARDYGWPKSGLNPGGAYVGTVSGVGSAENVLLIPILLGESDNGKVTVECDESLGQEV